jgi:LemA protein
MWTAIIIIGLIVILILWVVGIYNRLVALRNQVKNGWSQIDVQLQRRYDLIPNLVETVKGYMEFEKSTLQAVIAARNQASTTREQIQKSDAPPTGSAIKELQGAETALRGGLGQIFALAENYPQLRASETMQRLQEELSSTENKVAFARQGYNDLVMLYNTAQQEFPAVLFAAALGHHPAELWAVESAEAKQAVKVQF